jgi:hypothetical protein
MRVISRKHWRAASDLSNTDRPLWAIFNHDMVVSSLEELSALCSLPEFLPEHAGHVAARGWPNGRAPNGSKSSISSTLPRSPMRKRPFRSSHFTILYCEKLFSRL